METFDEVKEIPEEVYKNIEKDKILISDKVIIIETGRVEDFFYRKYITMEK